MFPVRVCVQCALFAFFAALQVGKAGEPLASDELLKGMRFERQKLVSGICSIVGTETVETHDSEGQIQPLKIEAAFSFVEPKIRFQHIGSAEVLRGGHYESFEADRLICLLPDRTLHYTNFASERGAVSVLPPNTLKYAKVQGTRGYFDPRCLGMLSINKLYDGVSFDTVFREFEDTISKCQLSRVSESIYKFGWKAPHSRPGEISARKSIFVDVAKGFAITQEVVEVGVFRVDGSFVPLSEHFSNTASTSAAEDVIARRLAVDIPFRQELTWEKTDGVWVPTSFLIRDVSQRFDKSDSGMLSPDSARLVELEFACTLDWSKVNEALDVDEFNLFTFGLPNGTDIFDIRSGKPVWQGRISTLSEKKGVRTLGWMLILITGFAIVFTGIYRYSHVKK